MCNSVSGGTCGGLGVEGSGEDGQCLWSIFWWRDANEQAGDKRKALEFTVVLRRGVGVGGVGSTVRMTELVFKPPQ